jgi:hypothetical protein
MLLRMMRQLNTATFRFAFTIAFVTFAGCRLPQTPSPPPGSMPLYLDEARMTTEVLNHVQIGMSVDEAKKIMERHGFKCRVDETSNISMPELESPTRLECVRVKPQENPAHEGIIADEIWAYMPIEAGKIKAIKVRHIGTCM